MKSIFIALFTLTASLTVLASNPDLVIEPKATLKVCKPRVAGCANKILINNTEYLISYDEANNTDGGIQRLMDSLISACREKQLTVSPAFSAEGFIVKEKGHFPNPTVEFTVFKLSYVAGVINP